MSFATRGMTVRADAFSEADVTRYLDAMRLPGVARAGLSYYRAALRAPERSPWPVTRPTLVLWGEQDLSLSWRVLLPDLARHVPDVRVERFADAGHWLHHDLPELVNRRLIGFFSAKDPAVTGPPQTGRRP